MNATTITQDSDLTPKQWAKAAKFCGFKTVDEYKKWLRELGGSK